MSDGLAAVYKFETRISDGGQSTNQLYTGLSGGFGTVTLGKMPNAAHVHAGFVDNSNWYGTSQLSDASKVGDTISYSVDVGAASFQVDAIADSGKEGKDADSAQFGATVRIGDNAKVGFGYISHATMDADTPVYKATESYQTAAISADAEPDGVAVTKTPAKTADPEAHLDKDNQAQIAGQYSIGGVTLHLGYSERKKSTDSKAAVWDDDLDGGAGYAKGLKGGDLLDAKHKTTFFGFAGGLGDTGFAYNFQMRSKKNTKTVLTHSYRDRLVAAGLNPAAPADVTDSTDDDDSTLTNEIKALQDKGVEVLSNGAVRGVGQTANDGDTDYENATEFETASNADNARGTAKDTSKNNPWVFGLSRSLGGGASVILEHSNVDDDSKKNTTGLFLVVNF